MPYLCLLLMICVRCGTHSSSVSVRTSILTIPTLSRSAVARLSARTRRGCSATTRVHAATASPTKRVGRERSEAHVTEPEPAAAEGAACMRSSNRRHGC